MNDKNEKMTTFKKWMISIRPFALPASTMPVIFGTFLAVFYGGYSFKPGLFLLAFFAMVILHSGANLLNDVADFKKGLDTIPSPVSGGVVKGILSTREALIAAVILLSVGTVIGLVLVWLTGPLLLVIGVSGVLVGVFYTVGGKLTLKYHALGDLSVFLNFGILGSLGAWFVQSGTFSWIPVIWAVPMAILVIAILHANNWRDIEGDKKQNIFTIASLLGDKKSLVYYALLIYGPFFIILGLVFLPRIIIGEIPALPFTFLITILSFPIALKLWAKALSRKTPKSPLDFVALDGATAQLNLVFGLLCTVALFLDAGIGLWF
ncbi:MAG: 1,4-dihydroxy-2-naphthoate octaprenyltransferase [Bacteroidales bacterium]|nr:1,4-dihydroxy-2-naphthoate octaprenyltransferase [Bacteroidales bacterium]